MKTPAILGLNWKMHPASRKEVQGIIEELAASLSLMRHSQITIFPPTLFFDEVRSMQEQTQLYISRGVQEISDMATGSRTGEIGAPMAANSGAEYALIGHSETRQYNAVSDQDVERKFQRAVEHSIVPMVCVGYQEGSESGEVNYTVLKEQVQTVLEDKRSYIRDNGIIIAYEPTWAIGTGVPADPETIETVALFIRKIIAEIAGQDTRDTTYILYGGSVDSSNVSRFTEVENINGFLLGGASLKPQEITGIVDQMEL